MLIYNLIYKTHFFSNSEYDKPTPQWCATVRLPAGIVASLAENAEIVFLRIYLLEVTKGSWFSWQCVAQDGNCHKDMLRCSSQQGLLFSRDSPVITSYTSLNRNGKSYHRTSCILAWITQWPTPSELCFRVLSTPSVSKAPVLPIINEIHWLSPCLISFLFLAT